MTIPAVIGDRKGPVPQATPLFNLQAMCIFYKDHTQSASHANQYRHR